MTGRTRRRRLGAAVLAAVLAGAAPRAGAGDDAAPTIREIRIVPRDVFDDGEGGPPSFWAYRFANKVHIETRESVVRRELLFAPGEPVDGETLEQTERNLRALVFIRDARVRTVPNEDGTVDVEVETWDNWSTVPELSARKVGDELTWAVGAAERNLLGRGKELVLSRRSTLEREDTFFAYRDPRLAGSRVVAGVSYSDRSDGRRTAADLVRPFFSLDTKWAFGLRLERFDQLDPLYDAGERVADLPHRRRHWTAEVARRFVRTDRAALRWHLAYRSLEDEVAGARRDFAFVQLGISLEEHRFVKLDHVNRFEVTEDFNLGQEAAAFVGVSAGGLGGEPGTVWLFFLSQRRGLALGPEHFLLGETSWQARRRGSRIENALAQLRLHYVNKLTPRVLLLASGRYAHGHRLDPEIQLTLGASNGLRGYPVHAFVGDRSLLLSAEARWFLADDVGRLASFALAGFVDAGFAWPSGRPVALGDLKGNVGLGLLVGRNRIAASQPGLRFDLAYALEPVPGRGRWLFSAGSGIGF